MSRYLIIIAVAAYVVLLALAAGRVRAADEPVLIDAFTYQVGSVEQVGMLQQALCKEFRYEPMIYDPVYVAECAAYYGPDQIQPVVYPEMISTDPFCESPPVIVNPENCPDYANRRQVAWFEAVIEKNDTALQAKIEEYIKTEKTAAAAGRGKTMIKRKDL